MSTEEDTELRDLVAQTLETNGCLPKIRAELRASIFLALDEDEDVQKQEPLLNKKVKTQLDTQEGRTMFCIVREFLEFFDLDYTISVYEPESYLGTSYQYEGRSKIIEELGITQLKDNSAVPLLLQLIKIAQVKNLAQTKNIDINLSKIQNEGYCNAENQFTNSSTRNKSKAEIKDKSTSVSEDLEHSLNSENSKESSINGILNPVLNETFNVSSPSLNHSENQTDQNTKHKSPVEIILNPQLIDSTKSINEEKDDTYDGTSSIAEDSVRDVPSTDLDKSVQNSPSETEFSPPILKDSKSHSKFDTSFDKLKLSPQKTEKIKAKSSLSSLADLPPLQLNKSRNDTVLLPSLYSKEFKERASNQNLRELDKFFDVDSLDNYEEDFMSESELNLNNKSGDNLKNSLRDELQSSSITDSNKNISFKNVSYSGKCLNTQNNQNDDLDNNQSTDKNKTEELSPKNTNGIKSNDNSGTNSVASDETNLNVDDILNSPTSN